MLVTRTEFAQLAGVSQPAVTRAVKVGRLFVEGNRLDTEHPTNKGFLEAKHADRLAREVGRVEREVALAAAAVVGSNGGGSPGDDSGNGEAKGEVTEGGQPGSGTAKGAEARPQNAIGAVKVGGDALRYAAGLTHEKLVHDVALRKEQVLAHRLKRLKELGRLMDREEVRRVLSQFNVEIQNRLVNLPRRLGPRLAAMEEAALITLLEDEISAAIQNAKKAAVV